LKSLKGLLNKNLKMTSLDLRNFRYLENLEGVQSMNNLKKIVLVGCDKLKNVDALKNLTHLKEVEMDGLRALESLEGLKVLEKSRTELDLYGFDSIKNLKGIQNFHKLQSLSITNNSLTDIIALKGLKSLKKLYISSDNLTLLKGIGSLPKLEILDIYVRIVKSLDGLKNLTALDKMVIDCDKLNSLKGLEQAPNITDLTICSVIVSGPTCPATSFSPEEYRCHAESSAGELIEIFCSSSEILKNATALLPSTKSLAQIS